MTPIQYFFTFLFTFLFFYGFVRPFDSIFARLFLIIGSFLGFISVLGKEYTNLLAANLGIKHGSDLYLYLGLMTIFLFIFYTLNAFSTHQKTIAKLTREIAILESKIDDR
ncbi:DUF2304 domain-containing protein [Pseudomonadota bacterium]|nr:DUF2304 domain-containing protein [Pseudomonadota bacterium]